MKRYIDKFALLAEINKRITDAPINYIGHQRVCAYNDVKDIIDTLEAKDGDLVKIDNNNPKITIGTKIRSKTSPDVILSIISDDCHGDEFECSNGSVLTLKQIERYYDIYIEEK